MSGLDWEAIAPCAKWMEPYFLVICDENEISPLALLESNEQVKGSYGLAHVCPNLVADSSHIIQTHTTSLDMFVSVSIGTPWNILANPLLLNFRIVPQSVASGSRCWPV